MQILKKLKETKGALSIRPLTIIISVIVLFFFDFNFAFISHRVYIY